MGNTPGPPFSVVPLSKFSMKNLFFFLGIVMVDRQPTHGTGRGRGEKERERDKENKMDKERKGERARACKKKKEKKKENSLP